MDNMSVEVRMLQTTNITNTWIPDMTTKNHWIKEFCFCFFLWLSINVFSKFENVNQKTKDFFLFSINKFSLKLKIFYQEDVIRIINININIYFQVKPEKSIVFMPIICTYFYHIFRVQLIT